MSCPPKEELLDRAMAGEEVPHLAVCAECAEYVELAMEFADAFGGRLPDFKRGVAAEMDELLEGLPPRHWGSRLRAVREMRHAVVIEVILERADQQYENPRLVVDLTSAAVALCEAMAAEGSGPPAALFVDALKEHANALRCAGNLDGALDAIGRAWAMTAELENREQLRAVLSLCMAITYVEPDIGRFDEAISLAESAAAVLDVCGDERRALLARQTKAHALSLINRFEAALEVALPVARKLEESGSQRDAAIAHNLVAYCYIGAGAYETALEHAVLAKCGYAAAGNAALEARAAHLAARAVAGLGRFDEARAEFNRTAEIFFAARAFDVWAIGRLDYLAAALDHDPAADVRGEVETLARVCLTLGGEDSTVRRRYAAEALEYLRRLAMRDALTAEAASYVRDFVCVNASRPPVRFTPPSGGQFVM